MALLPHIVDGSVATAIFPECQTLLDLLVPGRDSETTKYDPHYGSMGRLYIHLHEWLIFMVFM